MKHKTGVWNLGFILMVVDLESPPSALVVLNLYAERHTKTNWYLRKNKYFDFVIVTVMPLLIKDSIDFWCEIFELV